MALEVILNDHDLGSYPSFAVVWDEMEVENDPMPYVPLVEHALKEFNEAVDWSRLALGNFDLDDFRSEDAD